MASRKQSTSTVNDPCKSSPSKDTDPTYYSRWFNEDALVNQRLTWLLLAQGLLFAAYGTIATKAVDSCDHKASYLFSILGLVSNVGIAFAVVILFGIGAAILAQGILHYKRNNSWRSIGVNTVTTTIGWLTGLAVPVVFLLAWHYIPKPDILKIGATCTSSSINTPASVGSPLTPAPSIPDSSANAPRP